MKHRTADAPTLRTHPFAWVGAILALAVMLAPQAGFAQYSYGCSNASEFVDPFYNYKNCDFDFDGDATFERTAMFFENRGEGSDPPHFLAGDRHCYQGKTFEGGDAPEAADFDYIHFSLLLPENDTADFPVLLALRGGSVGWSKIGPTAYNSWRLDTDDSNPTNWTWDKGLYRGRLDLADGSKDEDVLLSFLTDDDDNIVDKLRQEFPGWAILVPSGCSHDLWNGRPGLVDDDSEFKNAAQTRYSYAALVETLDWVDSEYGIEYLYLVGGSGGGVGGFILAADLPISLSSIEFRGVVSEAGPLETTARESLFDPSDTRSVDADDNCEDTEATVACVGVAEPYSTAHVETGLDRSISTEIALGNVNVPIPHMFNTRDFTHCYDFCYSDANLHGAIRDAIDGRKAGNFDEDFDASESVEMCVGECKAGGVLLQCTAHTVLGWREGAPVAKAVNCAVNWIKQVNDLFDGVISVTQRPAACNDIAAGLGGLDPPPCGTQTESLF